MKKKSFWFVLLIVLVCFMTACSKKEKIESYVEITYKEFKEKIENKESFALFVGSHECIHCDDYKITLNKVVSDYQIIVYFIDIANMTDNETNEFMSIINFKSTPTTVFVIDGVEKTTYNRIVGALSYDKVVEKFKKAGYIEVK